MKYESMSIAELETLNNNCDAELEAVRIRKRAIAAAINAKEIAAQVALKVRHFSEDEREAARQIIGAQGVPSAERVAGLSGFFKRLTGR